jgi:hypothetical protein
MSRMSMLPLSALLMVCAGDAKAQAAPQNATDASQPPLPLMREGDFEQSDIRMVSCPAALLSKQHPEIQYSIELGETHHAVSAAPKDDKTALLWRVVVTGTGPASSHVELHAADRDAPANDEIWRIVQVCSKLKF